MRRNGKRRVVVVLSDFRILPILASIHISLSYRDSCFLVSEASLCFGDFGDKVRPATRKIIFQFLRFFFDAEIVRSSRELSEGETCGGCLSSLVSITMDSEATPEKYPETWDQLRQLAAGSEAVSSYIASIEADKVFLYNGRVASVRSLGKLNNASNSPSLAVYEYARLRAHYRILAYPIHDIEVYSTRVSEFGTEFARSFRIEDHEQAASDFIDQKLRNSFSSEYEAHESRYESVIFCGSPFEYKWAVDGQFYIDADPIELVKAAVSHPDFKPPAALRLHPYSALNQGQTDFEIELAAECEKLGIDLIGASNPASSHGLIEVAKQVFVGGSSIALDAYFLGKIPIFLGPNDYRKLIEKIPDLFFGEPRPDLCLAATVSALEKYQMVPLPSAFRLYFLSVTGFRYFGGRLMKPLELATQALSKRH